MPLSEHEQRMLEQIESALYAEDPKFASSVKRRRLGKSSGRRRLQAVAIFVVGLVMLVGGLIVKIDIGGFPIVSLLGFLVILVGMAYPLGFEPNNAKITVKLLVLVAIILVAFLNRKKETVAGWVLPLIGGLTVLNILLATVWKS